MAERKEKSSGELRLERTIAPEEVQWNRVLELLTSRFRVPAKVAKKQVSKVIANLTRPLELHWLSNPFLSDVENKIVQSMAEVHGADRLNINKDFIRSIGKLKFGITQSTALQPSFVDQDEWLSKY